MSWHKIHVTSEAGELTHSSAPDKNPRFEVIIECRGDDFHAYHDMARDMLVAYYILAEQKNKERKQEYEKRRQKEKESADAAKT